MPKRKRMVVCLPRKNFQKKKISEFAGPRITADTVPQSDIGRKNDVCLRTDKTIIYMDVASIDQGMQTEEFNKNDHDYFVDTVPHSDTGRKKDACLRTEKTIIYMDVASTDQGMQTEENFHKNDHDYFVDTVPQSDTGRKNDACLRTEKTIIYMDVASTSQDMKTEEFNKNNHDYFVDTVPHSDTGQKNDACLRTDKTIIYMDVASTDQGMQTEEFNKNDHDHFVDTVPHSDTGRKNDVCLRTDKTIIYMDVASTDQGMQTEEFNKNDHDYCANVSTSIIADDVCSSYFGLGMKIDHAYCVRTSCNSNDVCPSYPDMKAKFMDNNLMNDTFDPNVDEYSEVETTSFQTVVKEVVDHLNQYNFSAVDQLNGYNYSTVVTANKLSICRMYVHASAAVESSIELKSDFTCDVIVHRKPLSKTHEIWNDLPTLFDRSSAVTELWERARKYHVCCGNFEEQFTGLLDIGDVLTNNQQPGIHAYREGNFGAKNITSTIRSIKCDLFSTSERCSNCKEHRKVLHKRRYRKQDKLSSKRSFNHTSYKHKDMTQEDLIQKLTEQKSEITSLQREECRLKKEIQCFKIKESENNKFKELISYCHSDLKKAFPDSRQRLFWQQQQLHANKSNSRGMRWHPMIIRWCLYMRKKSVKAFAALRHSGFINLPSSRTMYVHNRILKGKYDFQSELFEFAKDESKL